MFSCVAQQLRVDIEFNGEYKVIHIHSKCPYEPEKLPSKKLTFKLNDLNADEKRNLIFQLHVPKVDDISQVETSSQQTISQDEHTIGKNKF